MAYDNVTGASQRGIAYDPEEDVIYVGGWNQGILYKFAAPQCNQNLQLLGEMDLTGSDLANIAGLAYGDSNGGIFVLTSGNPSGLQDMLGKVDFSSGEILWSEPAIFFFGPGSYHSFGLTYAPLAQSLLAVSQNDNTVNLFLHPEVDDCVADTFCFLILPGIFPYAYGIGQVDTIPYEFWNIRMEDNMVEHREYPEYIYPFIRGDANKDLTIDFVDLIWIANYLFQGVDDTCPDALDVNDNGVVEIGDLVYLANYLFLGGPSPPPPNECGFDPTLDSLWCRSFSCEY